MQRIQRDTPEAAEFDRLGLRCALRPFPGSPDDTTVVPQRLMVDYVRVYSR